MPHNIAVTATVSPSTLPAFPWTVNPNVSDHLVGNDFLGIDQAGLEAQGEFSNQGGTCYSGIWTTPLATLRDDAPYIGRAVRLEWPPCSTNNYIWHFSPTFGPVDRCWVRCGYLWENYTTVGDAPPGANSHKHAFLNYNFTEGGSGRVEIEFTNTNQYFPGSGAGLGELGTQMPGGPTSWGTVANEWTVPDVYEYQMYYNILKTGANGMSEIVHMRRRRTQSGVANPSAWTLFGTEKDFQAGKSPPQIRQFQYLANRNRNNLNGFNIWCMPYWCRSGADPFGTLSERTAILGQIANPASDDEATGWSGSVTDIDDGRVPDDTQYREITMAESDTKVLRCILSGVTDPATSDRHAMRVRLQLVSGTFTGTATLRLKEGATIRATKAVTPTALFQTTPYTLTTGETNAIGSAAYNGGLALELELVTLAGDNPVFRVSHMNFRVP